MSNDNHIDCDNQLKKAEDKIIALKKVLEEIRKAIRNPAMCWMEYEKIAEEALREA